MFIESGHYVITMFTIFIIFIIFTTFTMLTTFTIFTVFIIFTTIFFIQLKPKNELPSNIRILDIYARVL